MQSGDTCLQKAADAGNVAAVKYMVKVGGKPLLFSESQVRLCACMCSYKGVLFACLRMCVRMHACTHVCMYVFMPVCTGTRRIEKSDYLCTNTQTFIHIY